MSVRIALADDQALVLKGLSALIGGLPDLSVTLEASDAEGLLATLPQRPVDVVVSDIRMPGIGGIGLVQALRERGDPTPVILLTTFDDSDLMLAAVEVGAQGFLLKDAAPEDLREAIVRVARGDTLLQPVSLGPVRGWQATAPAGRGDSLSAREVDIVRLIAGGYSNKEIGRSLHLSEGTVKNYVTELLSRLDCRDRTHLVLTAIRRRLI
jgi:DNA-binding NarL/FixJ family response regulator